MVLEKTLESPLDCKEIQPVHSKGDQSWVFIGPPVPSLPAVPESLSCSVWGKAVRMPGQEIQLQVVIMPLICLISLDRYSGLNCVPHTQKGGFPGGTSGKEPAGQRTCGQRRGCNPWVRKTPWRTAWEPTPVFLPGESHGQRSLEGCSHFNTLVW